MPDSLLDEIQRDWARQEYARALSRMEAHWRLSPRDPSRCLHYATILGHCSRFHTARLLLDQLISEASPAQRLWAVGSAGVASCDFQRFDWAAEYLAQAAKEPNPPAVVFYRWAEALERLNRLSDAAAAIDEGTSRHPDHPGLTLLAARLARRVGAYQDAERLARQIVGMADAPAELRCQAGYELGHALDAQDRCAEAYDAYVHAKEIQRPHAETFADMWRARMRHMRSEESLPSAEDFRGWSEAPSSSSHRHAFLVGCPRSGTTLLERMLGSHPQVASSSESAVWHSDVWAPLLQQCGALSGMRAVLSALTSAQVEGARASYWRYIIETFEGDLGDRVLLDKNPSIFPVLPGAVRLFPQARVIVALRDPRDIVWSCFTQPLPINAGTAAYVRLKSTAEQVATELTQWFQLRSRLATPWMEMRYESLVRQTESELRRASAFLGLPWSQAVMEFHQRRDPVRSPTYAAVAQPVRESSVGRWRRYGWLIHPLEEQLKAVIPALE